MENLRFTARLHRIARRRLRRTRRGAAGAHRPDAVRRAAGGGAVRRHETEAGDQLRAAARSGAPAARRADRRRRRRGARRDLGDPARAPRQQPHPDQHQLPGGGRGLRAAGLSRRRARRGERHAGGAARRSRHRALPRLGRRPARHRGGGAGAAVRRRGARQRPVRPHRGAAAAHAGHRAGARRSRRAAGAGALRRTRRRSTPRRRCWPWPDEARPDERPDHPGARPDQALRRLHRRRRARPHRRDRQHLRLPRRQRLGQEHHDPHADRPARADRRLDRPSTASTSSPIRAGCATTSATWGRRSASIRGCRCARTSSSTPASAASPAPTSSAAGASCASASASPSPRTSIPRICLPAFASAPGWRWRSCTGRAWSSSTSRPPASTSTTAPFSGSASRRSRTPASRCSSPRTFWKRSTTATGPASSTPAASSPTPRRKSCGAATPTAIASISRVRRRRWPTPRPRSRAAGFAWGTQRRRRRAARSTALTPPALAALDGALAAHGAPRGAGGAAVDGRRLPQPARPGGARMSWRRLVTLMVREVRATLRDPFTLGMLIAVPLAALMVFGFTLSTEAQGLGLGVCDQSRTVASRRVLADIVATGDFILRPYPSRTAIDRRLSHRRRQRRGDLSARLRPRPARGGTEAAAHIQILYDGAETVLAGNAEASLRGTDHRVDRGARRPAAPSGIGARRGRGAACDALFNPTLRRRAVHGRRHLRLRPHLPHHADHRRVGGQRAPRRHLRAAAGDAGDRAGDLPRQAAAAGRRVRLRRRADGARRRLSARRLAARQHRRSSSPSRRSTCSPRWRSG